MYQIINTETGDIVALCDTPRYIKIKETSGAFIQCKEKEAQGVATNNGVFNLPNHTEIKIDKVTETEGEEVIIEKVTAPVAIIKQVDGGEVSFNQSAQITDNEVKIHETNETALTGLMATTDLYEELINKGVLD